MTEPATTTTTTTSSSLQNHTDTDVVDMDAILDEALEDLLDDDDDDDDDDHKVECGKGENEQSPCASSRLSQSPPPPPPEETVIHTNNSSGTDRTERAKTTSNPQNNEPDIMSCEDDNAQDPAVFFQKMLRDFIESDDGHDVDKDKIGTDEQGPDDDDDDDDEEQRLGLFMQQVQSQLVTNAPTTAAATSSTASSPTDKPTHKNGVVGNTNSSNNKKGATENNQVQETIAAILEEMANASLQEPQLASSSLSSGSPVSSSSLPTPTSEEERLLQEMLQSLASGKLPEGFGDMGNLDDDDDNDLPENFNADAFMDGMMEQLLSKDLMYEPMKQVAEKFPDWLEKNKEQLTPQEWEQRNRQYKCFQELVAVYETSNDGENSKNNTPRLMELMQQVQEYGQPPMEIVTEIAPDLELDEEGLPKMGGPLFGPGAGADGECLVM
jgi:peroxin-19